MTNPTTQINQWLLLLCIVIRKLSKKSTCAMDDGENTNEKNKWSILSKVQKKVVVNFSQ